MRCTCCEEEFESDNEGSYNTDREWYCDDCYDDKYAQCCGCQCEVISDDGEHYCDNCVDTYYFTCAHCSDREHIDYAVIIRNGDRICGDCDGSYYSHCEACDEVVQDGDWCSSCETCEDCCRCDYCPDCDEHNDSCTCHYCEGCDTHEDDCTCDCDEESETVRMASPPAPPINVSPFRDSGGNTVALIERLDNSKFELLPSNVTKVLGMLDKDGTLRASGIMGRPCTGDSGYYLITDVIHAVGKVSDPMYVYGVRSNEYDIVISRASTSDVLNDTVIRKLSSLGLTYTYVSSSKVKVGLSFKVRKHKYRKCIEFLKFYCNV